MHPDWLHPRKLSLLVALTLLINGCASLTPPPGSGRNLGYTPGGASAPILEEEPGEQPPRSWASSPESVPEPGEEAPRRQSATHARQALLSAVKDTKGSTETLSRLLSRLATSPPGWR